MADLKKGNAKSNQEVIQNPAMKRYFKGNQSFTAADSGSGVSAGDLIEITNGTFKTGTEQNTAWVGVTRDTVAASGQVTAEFGHVPVKLASPVANLDLLAARASGKVGKYMASQVTLVNAKAGGNFANQPAGDGVTVVSDNAADTTQTVTIYGTITGTTDSVTSETVSLNGTTDADTTITTWQNILAVEMSAAAAGTVEISETSGGAAITSITAGNTTAGIETISTTNCYGLVPRHDASGASTAPIAIIGTGADGSALSVVDALNGTTEEDHASTVYATATKAYIGAVASSVDVTILTNEAVDGDGDIVGMAQEASTVAGVSVNAYIQPYFTTK